MEIPAQTDRLKPKEMRPEQIVQFIMLLSSFDGVCMDIRNRFIEQPWQTEIKNLLCFPPPISDEGDYSIITQYNRAKSWFDGLRSALPDLEYNLIPDLFQKRAPMVGEPQFSYTLGRTLYKSPNSYDVFCKVLNNGEKMITFPDDYDVPYKVLTTGMMNGRTVRDGFVSQPPTTEFAGGSTGSEYIIIVDKGSPRDIAFDFFTALNFFDKEELADDKIHYKKKCLVDMDTDRRLLYEPSNRHSSFSNYCLDQELLSVLNRARAKQLAQKHKLPISGI